MKTRTLIIYSGTREWKTAACLIVNRRGDGYSDPKAAIEKFADDYITMLEYEYPEDEWNGENIIQTFKDHFHGCQDPMYYVITRLESLGWDVPGSILPGRIAIVENFEDFLLKRGNKKDFSVFRIKGVIKE